jgi:phosphoglycolate phosphatase
MKEVDLMIFDLDGTLASTGADLADAVNYTLRRLGLPEKQKEEIIAFVGDGIAKLLERALGQNYAANAPDAIKIFYSYYGDHLLEKTVLCPAVEEILNKYQDKKKVVLTNKHFSFAQSIVRGLNIEKYFVEIIGDGSTPYRKPDKRLVEHLLDKYKINKQKAVIIGDGINDINLAKNSGILCCVCLNGMGKREELLAGNADFYCENIRGIESFISHD